MAQTTVFPMLPYLVLSVTRLLAFTIVIVAPFRMGAQINGTVPGRFPEATLRLLTDEDVASKSEADLKLMRNEIYARHGYIFPPGDMHDYFASQRWYTPTTVSVQSQLTDIERKNILLIKVAEQGALVSEAHVTVTPEGIRLPSSLKRGLVKHRLPETVNTSADESNAIVSADGTLLVITYSERGSVAGQEIYISERLTDGSWGKARSVGPPLNNYDHNYAVSISSDKMTMIVGNRYNERGRVVGPGLSATQRTHSGWAIPTPLEIDGYVNTGGYVSACLAPSNDVLVLAIEGPGTRGKHDLYVSRRTGPHNWSTPVSLGATINTEKEETTPFIAADGRTLFFSSSGHPGYGKLDVFMSRRLDDTWTSWSKPVNLGLEVNGESNQMFYTVAADGSVAYFSQPGPDGSSDIWSVELPEAVVPLPTVAITGTVLDNATRRPVSAMVAYERLSDGKPLGRGVTDPTNGTFTLVVAAGEVDGDVFSIRAEAEGYFPISDTVQTSGLTQGGEIRRNLYLEPAKSGRTIRLNNVFFDVGKSEVLPESFPDLDRFVSMMESMPGLVVMIAGHTDDIGDDATNLNLSLQRARAVREYAVQRGIDPSRITAEGFGESKPIAPNTSAENRQLNRRVEFTILREK
jgi:outer membrane protein OmpA-like peptidoglycan-associated protein